MLECRLEYTTLENDRPYEALSYVWGSPEFTQEIRLNNKLFYITPNLETVLRHLRHSADERRLWVDAICIDQTNIDERNDQVGYMSEIYSHCSMDLFWLGEHDDEIVRGMAIIKKMDGFDINNLRTLDWENETACKPDTGQRDVCYVSISDWSALYQLLNASKIWSRIWVV